MCRRFFVILITKLFVFSSFEQSFILALTGRCNECFSSTNGIACLDEQNFAICINNTPSAVRTLCPTGSVCTTDENICLATAQGALPVCYEDKCGKCSSIQNNFACLDEAIYAFCYDGQTPATSSINYCPQGYVCDLENIGVCSIAQGTMPSCMPGTTDTTIGSSTDTTTANAADTTNFGTADSTIARTSDATSGTTPGITAVTISDTTTDGLTGSTTETKTNTATFTTTDSSTDQIFETTTDITTATSSGINTIVTAITTTQTTYDSTIVPTTDSLADLTTNEITITTVDGNKNPTSGTTVNTTPNTTRPSSDPNKFCAEAGRKGSFRPDDDTTCADYIYCYLLGGQYLGWRYSCTNYFNAATGLCQIERPADC